MSATGRSVWLPVADTVAWTSGVVVSGGAEGEDVGVRRDDTGETVIITAEELEVLPIVSSVDAVPLEDLTQLADVHDATMLDTLRRRYAAEDIFTAIGPVIISINPYKPVASCNSEAISELCKLGDTGPPHVARAAVIAFAGMTGASSDGEPHAQSILISGESGAGKTEACKLCLLSLAELSGSSGTATEAAIESALLLEAFGNAKTVYNDNSSRFGKWCSVQFDAANRIHFCSSEVYLLEKTRVVGPSEGERNYHIFYQMLRGASAEQRTDFKLLSSSSDYEYCRHGLATIDRVDDSADWQETQARMGVLGIESDARTQVLQVVSAVLALGNVSFAQTSGAPADAPLQPSDAAWLEGVAGLLGIGAHALGTKLTSRTVSAGRGSTYTVSLGARECEEARDSLAQSLYVNAFEWVVATVNACVRKGADAGTAPGEDQRFVGLLDIFGFENFQVNSFEQLCINFTNERLQGQFMDALVKLRVLEYEREGVPVAEIDFPDNEAQLALIDGKSLGIFAALDDECSVPKGADAGFVEKMHELFAKGKPHASPVYDQLRRAKGGVLAGEKTGKELTSLGPDLDRLSFLVVHYAEPVRYTADGWLDKNRGYLNSELALVLSQSESAIVRALYPASAADDKKRSTISSTFRRSLRSLSTTMLQTAQTYVRCVKPNGVRKADQFEGDFVLRQLRYTGVASVIEIQRSGYPVSLSHSDFLGRYRCIALSHPKLCTILAESSPADACKALLDAGSAIAGTAAAARASAVEAKASGAAWLSDLSAVVGKTRIFLKDHVMRTLEAPRLEASVKATLCLQRAARGMLARMVRSALAAHMPAASAVHVAIGRCDLPAASTALEALLATWSALRAPRHALVEGCRAEATELRGRVQELEEGLEAEAEALRELQLVLSKVSDGGEDPKAAFVKLKVAVNAAAATSKGLDPKLTQLITRAEEVLASCLSSLGVQPKDIPNSLRKSQKVGEDQGPEGGAAEGSGGGAPEQPPEDVAAPGGSKADLLAALEADVRRQEALQENERRMRQATIEKELVASASEATPSVELVKVRLCNDIDAESSTTKVVKGYSEAACGVMFSEGNAVSVLRRGGRALRDGLLKLGDVVIAVDGAPLNGERIAARLNAAPRESYELTVARTLGDSRAGAGKGEHSGWCHVIRAKDGRPLLGQWERRFWVVLEGHTLLFRDTKVGRVVKERTLHLKGAQVKTPVTVLNGKTLRQPPVIASFIERARFPLTFTWPNGEMDHDVVLAVATSADRAAWMKQLNKKVNELKALAPTEGWLMKKSGRKGNTGGGLAGMLTSGWKKRWFVLIQKDEEDGSGGTFSYYKTPTDRQALGTVVINECSQLFLASSGESNKPNSFCVTSLGWADSKPITTVLAAASNEELGRWMKATKRVISMSGGDVQTRSEMKRTVEARVSPQVANLIALSKLDREELLEVPLRKLYEVTAYLQLELTGELAQKATKKLKDKYELQAARTHIVDRIKAAVHEQEALEAAAVAVPRKRQNTTWEAKDQGMGGSGGGGGKGRARAPSVYEARPHKGGVGGGGRDYASLY